MNEYQESALEKVREARDRVAVIKQKYEQDIQELEAEIRHVRESMARVEKAMLRHFLTRAVDAGVPKSVIAEQGLGVSRPTLYKLLNEDD